MMTRRPLSAAEVDEVWCRWRAGQAVKDLARQCGSCEGCTEALIATVCAARSRKREMGDF